MTQNDKISLPINIHTGMDIYEFKILFDVMKSASMGT